MKTEQRVEELITEVETQMGTQVNMQEFIATFMKNNTEMKFLHLKELYRLGNSPEKSKQILCEMLDKEDADMKPFQTICHDDACDVFDMWLAK